jgi:hypothetical protein
MLGVIAVLGLMATAPAQSPQPFVPLFAASLEGWTIEHTAAGNFAVRDGVLRVEGPTGWLRSEGRYENFDLRVSFRFVTDDADSGVFFRADGATTFGRGWPNRSYQLQLRNPLGQSRFPPIGHLYRHGMPDGPLTFDHADAARLSTGTGAWQVLELSVVGDEVRATLNGEVLMHASGVEPGAGYIGLQGETGALEFREIAIRVR